MRSTKNIRIIINNLPFGIFYLLVFFFISQITLSADHNNLASNRISKIGENTNIFFPENKAIAEFSYTNPCYGSATLFTDESLPASDIVSWSWSFGDGGTSTNQNPSHTYSSLGNYNVALSIVDTDGNSSNVTHNIAITQPPIADFTKSDTACTTGLVFFYDDSTPNGGTITDYLWTFPDDHYSYDEDTYFVFLNTEYYYDVSLEVTDNNGCSHEITKNIYIEPDLQISFNADTVCFSKETSLTAYIVKPQEDSIRYFTWFFNDGSPQITTPNKTVHHTFTDAGVYEVKLQATNLIGCTDVFRKNIWVRHNPTADFSFIESYCEDGTAFTDLSTGDGEFDYWKWEYGDGEILEVYSPSSPNHLHFFPPNYQTYQSSLLAIDEYGCRDSISKDVIHYPCVFVEFYTDTNWICDNTVAVFIDTTKVDSEFVITEKTWHFGDGNSMNVSVNTDTVEYQYLEAGDFDVKLFVRVEGQGLILKDSSIKPVTILATPKPSFSFENICFGHTTTFTDHSNIHENAEIEFAYWDFGDNRDTIYAYHIEDTIINHYYEQDGNYETKLIMKANNNCTDSLIKTTFVYPMPSMGFYSDTTVYCGNRIVSFTDTSQINSGSIATRLWDFGDGYVFFSSADTASHQYDEGVYSIKLIDITDEHCRDSITLQDYLLINPVINADFDISPERVNIYEIEELTITNYVSENARYKWTLSDTISWENEYEPNIADSIMDTGTYELKMYTINDFGCIDSTSKFFQITPIFSFYVPTGFSPNGNGTNDTFGPIGKYFELSSYSFEIYNRWGKLIFHTNDFYQQWDGKTETGDLAYQDTYAWVIRLTDLEGNNQVLRGAITLLL